MRDNLPIIPEHTMRQNHNAEVGLGQQHGMRRKNYDETAGL